MAMTATLCSSCFRDPFLKAFIDEKGTDDSCSFGCTGSKALPLTMIADVIGDALSKHYSPVDTSHDEIEVGEDPVDLLLRLTGLEHPQAKAVVEYLRNREIRTHGSDQFFGSDLTFRTPWPFGQENRWQDFKQRVKFEARFLDPAAKYILDELSRDLPDFARGVAVSALPAGTRVYRARIGQTSEDATRIIEAGLPELGPPTTSQAHPGRMNAAGISVFYGAIEPDVAIAEVKPWVGAWVAVATFEATRDVRVLDLARIPSADQCESVFAPGFAALSQRIGFFRSFEYEIAEAVQPGQELIEYVPTQVVAEYVARTLELDGIIYRSAQTDEVGKRNVVLFPRNQVTESEDTTAVLRFPLKFVDGLSELRRVTGISVRSAGEIIWSRYVDLPPQDSEE
jgi:hypothetical protein